jgi:hypothetical protein
VDTTIVSLSGAEIAELQAVMTVGGTSYYGSLVYTYYTSGANAGKLSSVTYRRKTGSGGSWVNIKQFSYTYHDGSDANGNLNDLKTATEQQYNSGTSSWEDIAVSYYRYYVDTAGGTGFVHGLKIQIGPEGYRRAFNDGVDFDTDSDATLKDYADHYFEYDPSSRMITKEVAAVCVSCPGGGTTQDTFAYSTSGFSDGENNWKYKTVQTLPNSAARRSSMSTPTRTGPTSGSSSGGTTATSRLSSRPSPRPSAGSASRTPTSSTTVGARRT